MASKKCPKCGEENPAEAVMCWACYTPLAANATLGANAGLGAGLAGAVGVGTLPNAPGSKAVGVPTDTEAPVKKGIDPKIIGVAGFLLVAGIAAFFMSGALGGTTDEDPGGVNPTSAPRSSSSSGGSPGTAPSVPGFSGGNPGGGAGPSVPTYQTVAPPNPEFATGTVGILVPNTVAPVQAAGFARLAKSQISANGKWGQIQMCVFTDKAAADTFAKYQNARRGAPLTNIDFSQLATQGVWAGAPAFIEFTGNAEKPYAPSGSPTSWWQRR